MAKITLFEFNPQGNIQIGPGSEGEEGLLGFTPGEQAETSAEAGESEEEGGGIAKIVVPLVALVAIAAVVRFMGGDESEAEFEEEEAESEGGIQRFTTTTE